jgi:hypothetical protein
MAATSVGAIQLATVKAEFKESSMPIGLFWRFCFVLGHDLGLSVVGGSNRTNRGEIRERESVGGTTLEKTPLDGCERL